MQKKPANIISQLIKSEVRDDRSSTAAREAIVLELTEEAVDSVLFVVLIDKIKKLVIKVTAKIKRN